MLTDYYQVSLLVVNTITYFHIFLYFIFNLMFHFVSSILLVLSFPSVLTSYYHKIVSTEHSLSSGNEILVLQLLHTFDCQCFPFCKVILMNSQMLSYCKV